MQGDFIFRAGRPPGFAGEGAGAGHRFDILAKPIRPEALIEVVRKASGQA